MLLSIFATLISWHSVFGFWASDFDHLIRVDRSFEDSGAVCEEVARVQVQKSYPNPQFEVLTGIYYADSERVIGELDIVVLDHHKQKVVQVSEVKCWKEPALGLEKALQQRKRFLKSLRSAKELVFRSAFSGEQSLTELAFKGIENFSTIGQKGTIAVGYDEEMPYTLLEFQELRRKVMNCQKRSECNHP